MTDEMEAPEAGPGPSGVAERLNAWLRAIAEGDDVGALQVSGATEEAVRDQSNPGEGVRVQDSFWTAAGAGHAQAAIEGVANICENACAFQFHCTTVRCEFYRIEQAARRSLTQDAP